MAETTRNGADEQLAAWSSLVAVYQSVLHDVVRALENDAGLDSGVFSALAYLARAEPRGRLRLSELQELMHPRYSQPGLSRLVQRMEADGLVERRADPGDGRATILATTPIVARSLITHRFPLDAAAEAFAVAADRRAGAIKVVLEP